MVAVSVYETWRYYLPSYIDLIPASPLYLSNSNDPVLGDRQISYIAFASSPIDNGPITENDIILH